jgi:hypothetical protein
MVSGFICPLIGFHLKQADSKYRSISNQSTPGTALRAMSCPVRRLGEWCAFVRGAAAAHERRTP